jgi:serine-type D-Ala-D-Ala carboxypeptidase/endopeptidase
MTSRTVLMPALASILSLSCVFAQSSAPPDSEIRKILADRIERDHQGVGIVVGVIEPNGRRIVSWGSLAKDDKRPLNGDTVFEIGSMSKVFTSLLLMDMVQKGEVALTDPVAKFLPSTVKIPERNGKKITLQDLSTQSSGLPRMPSNFTPKDMENPYADYSVDQMYQFLSGYELTRDIGEKYEYSNLGVGLLGHALSLRAGSSYEALVKARITGPLEMTSTSIALTPDTKARFAVGHNALLKAVSAWDIPTLAGAGALRSTANDMLTFLAANLGYTKTPLAAAMAAEISIRRPTGVPGLEIAYAWHVITKDGRSIIWHNGGTGGFRTFMGFDPQTRVGVVALSNVSNAEGVDDIGRHLINASFPLATFVSKERKAVPVDTKLFAGYVGRYEMAPNFILNITRDGDRLYARATGQGAFEIFPEADKEFFAKITDIQVSFHAGSDGKATDVVVHQGGADTNAKRIEGEPEVIPHRKEIAVDPAVLEGYTGRYQVTPTLIMTVTLEGGHLFTQVTGQLKFEVFAESAKEFFLKSIDAQLTFRTDAQGKAIEVVIHQGGADLPCKRIGAVDHP